MFDIGPCGPTFNVWSSFNAVLNTFQVIVLAMLAHRAVRKNREDSRRKHDSEP